MTGNLLGERFTLMSFGESHGRCVGAVVDGCPAGLPLTEPDIQAELDLRKPGQSIVTTMRAEEDRVEILSGVFGGRTTGAPICMLIMNKDRDSRPYEQLVHTPRPGHADFAAREKYGGFNDYRGGGRFSGRITATFVMAGAIAKKLLRRTMACEVVAYSLEIGGIRAGTFTWEEALRLRYTNEVRCPDTATAERMKQRIVEVRGQGDSVGGIVECAVTNLPVGIGEPIFGSLDSDLSRALLAIPATKGVEFGSGFEASRRRGSENNDPLIAEAGHVRTTSNNAGGIVGGLSNAMPIVLRVAFKPASSIAKPQQTVNLRTLESAEIVVPGRHDPCVVPRAVPVVESVVAIVLADHAIRAGFIAPVLSE
jgi:chorismate synthase